MLKLNTTHYDAPKEHLVESLGLLPHWVVEYNLLGESDIVQYMTERYGFGELYRFGGDIKRMVHTRVIVTKMMTCNT